MITLNRILAMVVISALSLLMIPASAFAESEVTRNHSIMTDGVNRIEIENGVGLVEITGTDSNNLEATIVIKGSRQGILRKRRDVSDSDIQVERKGDTLVLRFNENDASAEWRVSMPEVESLNIDLGVGEVDVEIRNTALKVDNGVGEVKVSALRQYAGRIMANVGVGSATIHGMDNAKSERAIVTEKSSASAEGDKDISVDIGVGDASITIR